MKHKKSMFSFALIFSLVGDILYFGSLIFRDQMINLLTLLSTEYTSTDLNSTGVDFVLFNTCIIASVMYLITFLFIAISMDNKSDQRKYALYGVFIWFIADVTASIIFHMYGNIIIDLLLLISGILFLKVLVNED